MRELFARYPDEIAAVIVEPVAGNMGVVPPLAGFLPGLRTLTQAQGALLIFDEVMTGFRVAPGGAQGLYNVAPDLTTLGKVIGGGLPVGAYGGRRAIMEMIAPAGPVYQAGTLSGNPLAMAAGIATLQVLQAPEVWLQLDESTRQLGDSLSKAALNAGVAYQQTRVGTMFSGFFTETPVIDWSSVKTSDTERFGRFFRGMLTRGVYLAPSQFEAGFISSVHSEAVLAATAEAAPAAFQALDQ